MHVALARMTKRFFAETRASSDMLRRTGPFKRVENRAKLNNVGMFEGQGAEVRRRARLQWLQHPDHRGYSRSRPCSYYHDAVLWCRLRGGGTHTDTHTDAHTYALTQVLFLHNASIV